LTTSPTVSNPTTDLIEKVIDSFNFGVDLIKCELIIVCDGVKEVSD